MSRTILLLGKNGQVGWELQRALSPLGQVVACDYDSPGELKADFSQPESLRALVQLVRPHVIVNSAAHTAVDKAESEPDVARALNALSPGVVAQEAATLGALMVHYSTDYVFDGSGDAWRDESAPTGPLSTYGRTKLEGEQLVQSSGCAHLILRTSWVFAARGGNFAKTMLRLAGEREELKVVDDQVGAPTSAELLADLTAHALLRVKADHRLSGVYHCVAGGETSFFGYAQHVVERARASGRELKLTPQGLLPIASSAYPTPAARPLNSRLATHKFQAAFGLTLPHWRVGVDRMLDEILAR
jgi:dTDP-4-dehydrorhamnose reductase